MPPGLDTRVDRAIRRVRRTLLDAGCTLTGRRVLAMCSGGADSVALVALLGRMPAGNAPRSIDVLWVDHGLRDDVAQEAHAARRAAESIGARVHEVQVELASNGGLEAAAREARYAAALAQARQLGCDVVCTGHTASDQLEQALLALTGVTGHAGELDAMPVTRRLEGDVELVRPLLALDRATVESLCAELDLGWANDPTNSDADAHRRNAIRNDVVPALLSADPGAGVSIARAGRRARERADACTGMADALLQSWATPTDRIDLRQLAALEPAARRAVLARWLERSGLGRGLTERIVRAVEALAVQPARAACARVDLPGDACVRRDGYHLCLQSAPRHGGSQP